MAKNEVIDKRLQEVDDAIRSGYSVTVEKALAARFGVNRRQVRKYKARVLKRRAHQREKLGQPADVERFLDEVRDARQKAQGADAHGAVMTSLGLEAKVLGLEKPTEHLHKHKGGKTTVIISREYPDLGESG